MFYITIFQLKGDATMRKGVAITLVVLAVALFPAITPANSPIFIGVPGMINIGDETADDFSFANVFGMTLDEAVYDSDTADADLTWTFDDASGVILINTFTAASGTNLRVDGASTFDINYSSLAGGVDAGLATQFAGANAAALIAAADAGTLINLHVSDGTFMTSKEILVLATDGGTDAAGGVYANKATYGSGAAHAGFAWLDEVVQGAATGQTLDITDTRGLTAQTTAPDDGSSAYFGRAISPKYDSGVGTPVTIQQGKVYRLRTTVYSGNVGSGEPCRFRLRAGTLNTNTWDVQSTYENVGQRNFAGATALRTPTAGGVAYENLFCPPQDARFGAIAYGAVERNFRFFYDIIDVTGYVHTGELVFGNTIIDEFDRPDPGSNGYVRAFGSSGDGFNDLPIYEIGTLGGLGITNAPGWRYEALHVTAALVTQRNQNHTQLGVPGVGDTVTSCSYSSDGSQLRLFGALSGFNMPYWYIGEPASTFGAEGFHYNSAIPYSLMAAWSNNVYYRATFTLSADDDLYSNNPSVRLRFGNPFGVNQAGMVVAAGDLSEAGPDSTPTDYEVWWLGPDAAKAELVTGKEAYDNMSLTIDMLDFADTTGGSVFVDDVKVEVFPKDFFN
jgi:hypothetical protein